MDLVVFPEYALHGLSMDTNPEIMCSLDGPEVAAFKQACRDNRIWGCFSIMEWNPNGNPYNSGIVIDDQGEFRLYYRKLHPWVPVEPWEPGDLGIPVIDGPKGCKLALIICHDGMFPEMARECAYKGAEIMLRTAGYTAPIREVLALHQPVQRLLQSDGDGERLHVRLRRHLRFHGRGDDRQFRRPDHRAWHGRAPGRDHHRRGAARPGARGAPLWGVENNIYQLGHRGYSAVAGGAGDCPYTYMQDLVAGRYRLPWEDLVQVTDGTGCGFAAPTRRYSEPLAEAAE